MSAHRYKKTVGSFEPTVCYKRELLYNIYRVLVFFRLVDLHRGITAANYSHIKVLCGGFLIDGQVNAALDDAILDQSGDMQVDGCQVLQANGTGIALATQELAATEGQRGGMSATSLKNLTNVL